MAELVSPGVSISVTDESFYAAAGTGTVPLLVIATAQDKSSSDGTGTAAFTTAAQAGDVKLITSQRELLTQFGNPIFKTSGGTPLHGHELNEYGLQAAYSFLGLANRAYVVRADIDLNDLTASSTAPTVAPQSGSFWLDTASTVWGIKRWNGSQWVRQSVKQPTADQLDGSQPDDNFGAIGDYAVVYSDSASTVRFYGKLTAGWTQLGSSTWRVDHDFAILNHTALPLTADTGDVVLQMNALNTGTTIGLKYYSANQFTSEDIFGAIAAETAYAEYVSSNGAVSQGDLWADYPVASSVGEVTLKIHNGGAVNVATTLELSDTDIDVNTGNVAFTIAVHGGTAFPVDFTGKGDANSKVSVANIAGAINAAVDSADEADELLVDYGNGKVTITSRSGYDIALAPDGGAGGNYVDLLFDGTELFTNWERLSYESSATEITGTITDGKLWYDNLVSNDNIDILHNDNGSWVAYPDDVQVAASQPTTQSDGVSALSTGDLWVDSSDLENYPQIHKYSGSAWVLVDTADQVSSAGIIFGDFRSSTAGLDSDAPQATLYPFGMLAWNKRMSGGNVKEWDATDELWVDYSGNKADGTPYMLRKAQRASVVRAMQSAVNSNTDIRNESNRFNLMSCPGYPELLDELISVNVDRKETAFIITDAPLRLSADATSTQDWATNANNATENGEDGLVTNYTYSSVYYPHGLSSDLAGNNIVVPASHIALRTLAFNDQVAFPWFAPAGFQRGVVTNASSVGYIDSASGEYKSVSLSEGQRDSLYINKINPIGQFPGRGLAVFGQKTLSADASALDRVNVARLTVYIRERLDDIVKPFLFEPNDEVTRQNAKTVVDRFLSNLITQRGLFDFVSVCDTSNNTPDRIDRNELHIDIAIQPLKAVEFIYIPIRVQNTLGQSN